jgi:hypothetical protein
VQLALAGPHLAASSQPAAPPPMTLSAFGMNLHSATTADGRDRRQLERICRYLLRPPFAHDAVTALPGGRVRVSFKAPWRGGTAHADMDAHQFLARLCALVPPPGFHMTRYYGVFASHHRLRERVIPRPAAPPPPPQLALYAAPHDHELVHLITFAVGRPPAFFIEGAAVAFELPAWYTTAGNPGWYPIIDLLTARSLDPAGYLLAGAYTRYLIDRFGMDAYLEFYGSLERSADLETITAAHFTAFSEPLEDSIAAFDRERRDCEHERFRFKLIECAGPHCQVQLGRRI